MQSRHDITGQRFGRLVAIKRHSQISKKIGWKWLCKCDCGNKSVVLTNNLRNGHVKSCGCLNKEIATERKLTHGMSKSRFYRIWSLMIDRCSKEYATSYDRYGANGIKVCERWMKFENFYKDMFPSYKDGLTIDRIDNNKGYSKNNCRWATYKEQANNTSRNIFVTIDGQKMPLKIACEKLGLNYGAVRQRIHYGWNEKDALYLPIRRKKIAST